MRKVLSLVLVLALVLGSFAFTFAASPSDVVGEDCEDAVNVLMELGVVTGYSDGSFKPGAIVTRAEMAAFIIRALGLNPNAASSTQFADVPASHWASKFVAYAASLGIIYGRTATMFDPDATVSYDEAVTMLVRALGYNEESLMGVYPAAYVSKAKSLGIIGDIQAGTAGANRGDIAMLVFNTLDQEMGKTDKDGVWQPYWISVALGTTETMLTRLDADLYTPVGGAAGDAFVLTDALADNAVADVRDLVGAYVTAYENGDGDILAIKEVESVFLTGEFDAAIAAATEFSTDDQDYDVQGQAYYTANSDEFRNGVLFNFAPAGATEYKIAADVSGIKIKDIYSVSVWTMDADFQFADGDLEDDNIAGHLFTLDDNDNIDLSSFELVGVDSLEDIEEDNVIYVYDDTAGAGGNITKLEVGTEMASGEVTKIKSGDYTVGGEVFEFSAAAGAVATRPAIGDEIEMTLDVSGDIYDYEIISGESDMYGIVLRMDVASENMAALGASDAEIEIFMADGTKDVFVVNYDEMVANGGAGIPLAVYNTNGGAADTWALGAGDIIEYDLNTDGEIEAIEWVVDASAALAKRADTVKVVAAADMTAKGYYQASSVATDALIMSYDSGAGFTTDEDDYGVADRAGLLDSTIPANTYYVLDSGIIVFMYIDNDATAADEVFGVVVDAEENSSDAGFGVDMLIDGEEVFKDSDVDATAWVAANFNKLYMIEYNTDGTVKALTAQALLPGATGILASANANGTAVDLSGSVVELTAGNFVINGVAGAIDTITLNSDVTVYEWNATDGVYDSASVSAIDGETEVSFFDTVDDGAMIFDIVLIHTGAAY